MTWQGYKNINPSENRITREALPQVLLKMDPGRVYLPSSPYIEEIDKFKSGNLPEDHLWGKRDYFRTPFYYESFCSFASEIGYHGCPSLDSVKRFISEEKLWPNKDNNEWLAHATAPYEDPEGQFNYRIDLMSISSKFVRLYPQYREVYYGDTGIAGGSI